MHVNLLQRAHALLVGVLYTADLVQPLIAPCVLFNIFHLVHHMTH